MLQLKNIKKSYKTGEFVQHALQGVSIDFRKSEFTAILGPSGSGKTTLLNIIGGLDRYDEGDLIINGKSTKDFKDSDWDAYRNNSIGFIFQDYDLISHISVLANVEMSMTLNGVPASEKKRRALEVLDKVGLKQHIHKKPNQLSGGQMQRVAIARALVNNPDIILADEPTGALDTATSVQIMDLIKEIAKDKLVIMVTHNSELAEKYASRIIKVKDGEIESDSNVYDIEADSAAQDTAPTKKTSMNFFAALKLSFNNIWTKKGRTFLTAFASSIGIIGISIILALSNGFNKQVNNFQSGTLSNFPIMIQARSQSIGADRLSGVSSSKKSVDTSKLYPYDAAKNTVTHTNNITDDYVNYINSIGSEYVAAVSYTRAVQMNFLDSVDNTVSIANSKLFTELPISEDSNATNWVEQNYDLLSGKYPASKNELMLVADSNNNVDMNILKALRN